MIIYLAYMRAPTPYEHDSRHKYFFDYAKAQKYYNKLPRGFFCSPVFKEILVIE